MKCWPAFFGAPALLVFAFAKRAQPYCRFPRFRLEKHVIQIGNLPRVTLRRSIHPSVETRPGTSVSSNRSGNLRSSGLQSLPILMTSHVTVTQRRGAAEKFGAQPSLSVAAPRRARDQVSHGKSMHLILVAASLQDVPKNQESRIKRRPQPNRGPDQQHLDRGAADSARCEVPLLTTKIEVTAQAARRWRRTRVTLTQAG